MRTLGLVLSVAFLGLALVQPAGAGRMKDLLISAEEAIYAEMSSIGDYEIEITKPELGSNQKGVTVTAVVNARDNLTGRSSVYVCEVLFVEMANGNYEPSYVDCY